MSSKIVFFRNISMLTLFLVYPKIAGSMTLDQCRQTILIPAANNYGGTDVLVREFRRTSKGEVMIGPGLSTKIMVQKDDYKLPSLKPGCNDINLMSCIDKGTAFTQHVTTDLDPPGYSLYLNFSFTGTRGPGWARGSVTRWKDPDGHLGLWDSKDVAITSKTTDLKANLGLEEVANDLILWSFIDLYPLLQDGVTYGASQSGSTTAAVNLNCVDDPVTETKGKVTVTYRQVDAWLGNQNVIFSLFFDKNMRLAKVIMKLRNDAFSPLGAHGFVYGGRQYRFEDKAFLEVLLQDYENFVPGKNRWFPTKITESLRSGKEKEDDGEPEILEQKKLWDVEYNYAAESWNP